MPIFLQPLLDKMSSIGDRVSAFISGAGLPRDSVLQALAAIVICGGSATDWSHQPAEADHLHAEGFAATLELSKGMHDLLTALFFCTWICYGLASDPQLSHQFANFLSSALLLHMAF